MAKHYNTLAELQRDEGGAKDNEGHAAEKWVTQAKAWGELKQISSGETETTFNQKVYTSSYSFETWYQPGLAMDASWRLLLLDGRILYLAGHPNNVDNRNRTWLLIVQERHKTG